MDIEYYGDLGFCNARGALVWGYAVYQVLCIESNVSCVFCDCRQKTDAQQRCNEIIYTHFQSREHSTFESIQHCIAMAKYHDIGFHGVEMTYDNQVGLSKCHVRLGSRFMVC